MALAKYMEDNMEMVSERLWEKTQIEGSMIMRRPASAKMPIHTVPSRSINPLYRREEIHSKDKINRRLIDGSVTDCRKCVGYCACPEHPGFITKQQRKTHDCVRKDCPNYIGKKLGGWRPTKAFANM